MQKNSGLAGVKTQRVCKGNTKKGKEKSEAGLKGTVKQKINRVVENAMLDEIRNALLAPDSKGVPYFQKYISEFLKEAKRDVNSVASRMLCSGIFNENLMKKLDSEANSAIQKEKDFVIYRLRTTMFDKQTDVFDNDFDREILVICSRRSGKTELSVRKIIKYALKGNTPILYLNKTFGNAINQIWNLVIDVCDRIDFKPCSLKRTEGLIEWSNGSSLRLGGVSDIESIEKYRGYKHRLIWVDEVGHLGKNTDYLINEVLVPSTADYADSQIVFSGTPPRVKNYAVRLWNTDIKKYHWTLFDNPFIPDAHPFVEGICKEKGITIDDPFIQREYYGVVGAYDKEAIVFKNYKTYKTLPSDFHLDKILIGVDFGFVDYNAIVSIMVDNLHKTAYIYKSSKFNRAGTEDIIACIQNAFAQAQTEFIERGLNDKGNILIVTDTNVPAITFDLGKKYGLPSEKAYKYDKSGSINELATALRTRVFIQEDLTDVIDECESTVWKRDENDNLIPEIDDDVFHPDCMDAIRYAYVNISQRWGLNKENPQPTVSPLVSQTTMNETLKNHLATLPPQFSNMNNGVQSLGRMSF